MRNLFLISCIAVALLISDAPAAETGWESAIKVSVLNAENKLSFGQRPDATDGIDGLYEVPAMLSGDIEAYFVLGDGRYWRDIKSMGGGEWVMVVSSPLMSEAIKIGLSKGNIPSGMNITLMDDTARKAFDLKAGAYSYVNDGPRQIRIVIGR